MIDQLIEKIFKLKNERQAVILAHNYQRPEVQDIADYVGDSLGLSLTAAKTEAKVVVFCGVDFMAETAAIISPAKTVLVPEPKAGCPMADMITAEKLRQIKLQNPNIPVVCYVNSAAAVKAEADVCCTSANAVKVVNSLSSTEIVFVPDKFLGLYVQSQLPHKKLVIYHGYCPTHTKILPEYIAQGKKAHPQAKVLVHPECRLETIALADAVLSTDGMLKYVAKSEAIEYIVGTEIGLIHRLEKENPAKKFYPATQLATCPNMKMTTLEKVLWSLEEREYRVVVEATMAQKARTAIEKMMEIGRQD